MIDSYGIALSAIASGLLGGGGFVWGYYTGRKDRTPGDRK